MSYKQFNSDFRNGITGSCIFMHGEEDFLKSWALDMLKDRYVDEAYRAYDVVNFDGDSCDPRDIMAAARAYSMFSERRLVIVNNYRSLVRKGLSADSASDEELLEFLKENNDSSIIVFIVDRENSGRITSFGKKVMKLCSTYDFERLGRAEFTGFVSKRVHTAGLLIGRREMDYLVELSGYFNKESDYTLTELERDLTKITNACEGDSVSMELIEELMVGAEDKFVFGLIDALIAGNKKKAMEMTVATVEGNEGEAFRLLSLLIGQFEIMYDAVELSAAGMSMQAMAKATGVNEYRFKKAYQATRHFGRERLKELLIKLYNIDRDLKTGEMDIITAFELFIATV